MTPAHESDISWQVLRRILKQWAGDSTELTEVKPLLGGSVNTTLCLTMKDGLKAVLKICAHRVNRSYAHEAFQLEVLRNTGIPVPQVYLWNVGSLDDPFSYILMEFVEGFDLNASRKICTQSEYDELQSHLAELVLSMHQQTADRYGRVRTDAPKADQWAPFFREVYEPMLCDISKLQSVPVKCRKRLRKIHDKLEHLVGHSDCPRLVHWDLWATNLLAKPDEHGKWKITAVLDPNCKYAHAEAELAYMELFHTTTPTFFKTYQRERRLPSEYHRVRKPLYQVYSLMNHVHVFGNGYVNALAQAVDRVSAVM